MAKERIKSKLQNEGYSVNEYERAISKNKINSVPNKAGVYALFYGNKLQYIGQGKDLERRIRDHINNNQIPFGSLSWFDIHHSQLNNAEQMLIDYYKPPYNKT